jgi:hypothetical protein
MSPAICAAAAERSPKAAVSFRDGAISSGLPGPNPNSARPPETWSIVATRSANPDRVVVRGMHDPGAEADVPGGRGKYAELHLGRRVMRVLRHQMVRAEERVVESEAVGEPDLFEHLGERPALLTRIPVLLSLARSYAFDHRSTPLTRRQ